MKKYNVCIVGGGSTYTPGFLKSFVRLKEEFPIAKLVLFDNNAERQEVIGEFGKILFGERFKELEFSYTTDPKTAYENMDFVFMQMRSGGLQMRREDEHIPFKLGKIGQETCGAGGMAYGLRSTIDMIIAVRQIRQYSPNAWILNYSNPAAIVAEALRREFPNDKRILNICDQPENVIRSVSRLLGCSWEDLDPVYFGLNHYGWFTHVY
ncbi:MAG: 6-phospho-alpha-glucosidase, partial [Solobacterium sp.]|nr:6-phospho-alpha-glucosidase [Solobacterium sp.]